ncbi:MAG TPA: NUDIX hydrolase [Rhodothermales bacterium]|nr:NUDIX hydrolase [Rhodothermales bacterium]
MIQPWKCIKSEPKGEYKVFRVRQDHSRSPRSGRVHPFYVIEATDWVNIIPVTPDGQFVFIRQYRHGVREMTLEVPGGMVDPGETAAEAARREMLEETGYDTEQIIHLGGVEPNPAIQNNVCHSYLALDACPRSTQNLEGTEEIDVVLVDPAEVPGLIVSGQITHALVVTAFYLYDQYLKA